MSPDLIWILYANMSPTGLASPRSVPLWIEQPSSLPMAAPNPHGLHKVTWHAGEKVYWFEMTERSFDNFLEEIVRVLEPGYKYQVLVRATREATPMVQNAPDEPLSLGEMVPLLSGRDVCNWGSMNMLNKPMDLLCYDHLQTADEGKTPSPVSLSFSRRNNGGPSPDQSQSSADDSSQDGMNPVSSPVAAKRVTRSTRTNTMKKTEIMRCSGPQTSTNQYLTTLVFLLSAPIRPALRFGPHLPIRCHLLVSNLLTLVLT